MKKMHPMSVSMSQAMKDIIDKKAAAKNQKTSDFLRRLIGHFGLERNDIKPVVFQIPQSAMGTREELEAWLSAKTTALVDQFFPETA
jgi:hypothetical protein